MDVARNDEQRDVFAMLMAMKAMGRPYFVAPETPKDRTDAFRDAFMETMRDPGFLAEAAKTLGQIIRCPGPTCRRSSRTSMGSCPR
ncbi:MAG TPA: hypothetical protein VK148_22645 [Xanthobacteraceae bacterium]|nr:hypothetical protein [Xanthobacteraceae bacterium]